MLAARTSLSPSRIDPYIGSSNGRHTAWRLRLGTIAERLSINEGDPVTCARYFIRMGNPEQPVTSDLAWESLAIIGGTGIELPHERPHADKGIVDGFSTIGHEVNQVEERPRHPHADG
jgi:hypothetical protein